MLQHLPLAASQTSFSWGGLAAADLAALALYFAGITWLGIHAGRKVHDTASFIMPRRFGKLMMMMHGFGTATHSDQAVSVASKSYTSGLSGIWYQWLWLFATPFYWLIAPMMRRFRALTTADVFESRFDRSTAVLYSVFGLMKFVVTIGLMLKGTSAVIDACTAGAMPADVVIIVVTVLFVVYGLVGGLSAAILTDFVQGLLTIVFSFMLLPTVLAAVGGLDALRETVGSEKFSLVAPGEIGVFYIFVIALNALLGVVVQPQNMGTCAAGRTEIEGAVGFMGGNLIKRVCTVAWCLTGLAALAYYGQVEQPDEVYGMIARDFLPQILPGLLGLFIAALLATVMGSCDSFMIAASGLVVENLYRPFVRRRSERHYLLVARVAALVVVAGGVAYAYWLEGVIQGLENLWKVNSIMAAAFWLGLFWRRTTVAGAWAATLSTASVWWLTSQPIVIAWIADLPMADALGLVTTSARGEKVYLPWQMLFYLSAGFGSGIVVSLLTKPVATEKLDRYYSLLRTPVAADEQIDTPCTLPPGTVVPPRRVLFPNSNLEIPVPTRRAVAGFAAGWACVLLLVGAVVVLIAA